MNYFEKLFFNQQLDASEKVPPGAQHGLGWSAGRVRVRSVRGGCGLEVCGEGAGKLFQTPAGAGRRGFEFDGCGAGEDKKFQPAQDSDPYPPSETFQSGT